MQEEFQKLEEQRREKHRQNAKALHKRRRAKNWGKKMGQKDGAKTEKERNAKVLTVRVKIDDEIIEIDQSESSVELEDSEEVVGQSAGDQYDYEDDSEEMEDDPSAADPDMEDEEHMADSSFSFAF